MTAQQKHALASLRSDPFTMKFKELQQGLSCDVHPGKYCYKPALSVRPLDHVHLDAQALRDWTNAIMNNAATLNNPPRTAEFDRILNQRQKNSRTSTTPSEATTTQGSNMAPIIHYNLSDGFHNVFKTPRSPRNRSSHSQSTFSSPFVHHETFLDGDGLLTFIKWCEKEYKIKPENLSFEKALITLRELDIDVDILKGKNAEWYRSLGITAGTSERLARSFLK